VRGRLASCDRCGRQPYAATGLFSPKAGVRRAMILPNCRVAIRCCPGNCRGLRKAPKAHPLPICSPRLLRRRSRATLRKSMLRLQLIAPALPEQDHPTWDRLLEHRGFSNIPCPRHRQRRNQQIPRRRGVFVYRCRSIENGAFPSDFNMAKSKALWSARPRSGRSYHAPRKTCPYYRWRRFSRFSFRRAPTHQRNGHCVCRQLDGE